MKKTVQFSFFVLTPELACYRCTPGVPDATEPPPFFSACVDITGREFGCDCQSVMTELNTGVYLAISDSSGQGPCGLTESVCTDAEARFIMSIISLWVYTYVTYFSSDKFIF